MTTNHTRQLYKTQKELAQVSWKLKLFAAVMVTELDASTVIDILDRLAVRNAGVAEKETK